MPSRSRSYTVTAPFTTLIYGIPINTFIASCITGSLYLLIVIVLAVLGDCAWSREKAWFFGGCLAALCATIFTVAININYTRYRFTKLSLSASLAHSGTAAVMLWLLIHTLLYGLCQPKRPEREPQPIEMWALQQEEATNSSTMPPLDTPTEQPDASEPDAKPIETVFARGHLGAIICWIMAVPAAAFQIVTHYYYG